MKPVAALLTLAVVTLFWSCPASAGESYDLAKFEAIGVSNNVSWTRSTDIPNWGSGGVFTSLDTPGVANVIFTYLSNGGAFSEKYVPLLPELASLGSLPAVLKIASTYTQLGQHGSSGYSTHATFSFSYAGTVPLTVNGVTYNTGANLLTLSNAGVFNGQGGWFMWGYYSSDLADFSGLAPQNSYGDIRLDHLPPLVLIDNIETVNNFVGRFDQGYFAGGVAEPATWAMMIIGFGLAGSGLRRARPHLLAT